MPKMHLRFYPDGLSRPGRHTADHADEPYREAWHLLAKKRAPNRRPPKA